MAVGDIVLVGLRDYQVGYAMTVLGGNVLPDILCNGVHPQDDKCDVILKYSSEEVRLDLSFAVLRTVGG